MKLRLLKPCNAIFAHTEEKYPVFRLHVDFAKKADSTAERSVHKERTAREDGERKKYAAATKPPQVASFSNESRAFVQRCYLT